LNAQEVKKRSDSELIFIVKQDKLIPIVRRNRMHLSLAAHHRSPNMLKHPESVSMIIGCISDASTASGIYFVDEPKMSLSCSIGRKDSHHPKQLDRNPHLVFAFYSLAHGLLCCL
jgi:predicted ATPase